MIIIGGKVTFQPPRDKVRTWNVRGVMGLEVG